MGGELIANGGSDKIRAIRIEPFLYREIDLSEIDRAEIDGDLFGVGETAIRFRCFLERARSSIGT